MFVRNKTFHVVFAIGLLLSFIAWLGLSIDGILAVVEART